MNCVNCNSPIEDGAKFCNVCGAAQPAPAPEQPQADRTQYTAEPQAAPAQPQYAQGQYTQPQYSQPQYTQQQYYAAPGYNQTQGQQYAQGPYYAAPVYNQAQGQQYAVPGQYVNGGRTAPALQLPTVRGLLKFIFLGLITLGIYDIVIMSRIATEINIVASRSDGKRTMPFFAMLLLSPFTLGIYSFVWIHGFSNRVGDEVRRRGFDYKFGASTFWLWGVLGSLILVGPYIYCHKLLKSMNMINGSYNIYG